MSETAACPDLASPLHSAGDGMFSTRRSGLRPWTLFLRGVGSLIEICPPKSRYYELLPPRTVDQAFAEYRANIEHYLGAATRAWEAEQEEEPPGVEQPPGAPNESDPTKSEEEETG